jgi:hypothetical protein
MAEAKVTQKPEEKKAPPKPKHIQSIDLSDNDIGSSGATSLAEAIKLNCSLTELNLANNNISDIGATAILDALKTNANLTNLDLRNNNIGSTGASSISDALKLNSTLTTLDLRNNKIGNTIATAILDALKINFSLTKFEISDNTFPDDISGLINTELEVNKDVTKREHKLAYRPLYNLLEDKAYADYLIGSESHDIKAHKFIVSSRCPKLLTDTKGLINSAPSSVLKKFIEYLYTNTIFNVSQLTIDERNYLENISKEYSLEHLKHVVNSESSTASTYLDDMAKASNSCFDITLEVKDVYGKKKELSSHKAVLFKGSEYFKGLFFISQQSN